MKSPLSSLAFAAATTLSLSTALIAASSRTAHAQAVTVDLTRFKRYDVDGNEVELRAFEFNRTGVSRADCQANLFLEYYVTITSWPQGSLLQAWAGSGDDCKDRNLRSGANARCWPLTTGEGQSGSGTGASFTKAIRIPARTIVQQIGSQAKDTTAPDPGSEETCTRDIALTSVAVYFMLLDGAGNVVGTAAELSGTANQVQVKLSPPPAPTNVEVGIGDQLLVAKWTPPTTNETLNGYRVFAQAAPASIGSTTTTPTTVCDDAGAASDGGALVSCTDASVASTIECKTNDLFEGAEPSSLAASATVPRTSTNATVTGLNNGETYAVAVSTIDNFGNVSKLGTPVCEVPQEVDDFYSLYRRSGGLADGCASGGSIPLGTAGAITLLAIAATVARRRSSRS